MTLVHLTSTGSVPEREFLAANPEAEKLDYYPLFDWLRFALASIVVLGHAHFQIAAFLTGTLAVDVFFALSGWLIGAILLRTEVSEMPRFFFNRATRIWITYAVAIVLLYGIAALREGVNFFWLKYLVLDVTFTHQLYTIFPAAGFEMPLKGSGNQFWSLAVEEQFYLVAPLVMLFVPFGKTLSTWLLIAVVTLLLGWHAGPVALGVCAAVLQRDHAIAGRLWVRLLAVASALACAVALTLQVAGWIASPLFGVAVVVALAIPGRRSKVAMLFGGLSFPLYLNQWLGLAFVNGMAKHLGLLGSPGLPFVAYLFALGFTVPLYWFVDRRVLRRRNDWYSPALGRRLGWLAYALVITGILAGGAMQVYGPHGIVPPDFILQSD